MCPDVVRVDITHRAFQDVAQSGDTRVGVEARFEGRALMVEKVEKHERLQDLAEVGRAHQTCRGALRSATGTLHVARAKRGSDDLARAGVALGFL